MDRIAELWHAGDPVGQAVALLLLAMSVVCWVLILWRGRVLARLRRDLALALPAFWAAPDLDQARRQLQALDREALLLPMVDAAVQDDGPGSLAAETSAEARLTRRLRDALHAGLLRLQTGQVVLASIGATAPFVGLFGTVWGVTKALLGLAGSEVQGIDAVAGPVGEALVMTAAGLAVAIPAVLAYNAFGQRLAACEAELEGWAHDLRAWRLGRAGAPGSPPGPRA